MAVGLLDLDLGLGLAATRPSPRAAMMKTARTMTGMILAAMRRCREKGKANAVAVAILMFPRSILSWRMNRQGSMLMLFANRSNCLSSTHAINATLRLTRSYTRVQHDVFLC